MQFTFCQRLKLLTQPVLFIRLCHLFSFQCQFIRCFKDSEASALLKACCQSSHLRHRSHHRQLFTFKGSTQQSVSKCHIQNLAFPIIHLRHCMIFFRKNIQIILFIKSITIHRFCSLPRQFSTIFLRHIIMNLFQRHRPDTALSCPLNIHHIFKSGKVFIRTIHRRCKGCIAGIVVHQCTFHHGQFSQFIVRTAFYTGPVINNSLFKGSIFQPASRNCMSMQDHHQGIQTGCFQAGRIQNSHINAASQLIRQCKSRHTYTLATIPVSRRITVTDLFFLNDFKNDLHLTQHFLFTAISAECNPLLNAQALACLCKNFQYSSIIWCHKSCKQFRMIIGQPLVIGQHC